MDEGAGKRGRNRGTALHGGRKPTVILGFAAAAGLAMCVHSSSPKTSPSDSLAPYAALVAELDFRKDGDAHAADPPTPRHAGTTLTMAEKKAVLYDRLEQRPADAYAYSVLGNRYLSVTGDFDDDGRSDEAFFVRVNDKGAGMLSLIVSFGAPTKHDRIVYTLEETEHAIRNIGLKVARAGHYTGACAKGFGGPCEEGEDAFVLPHDGIVYFWFEPPQGSTISPKTHWTVTSRCSICRID